MSRHIANLERLQAMRIAVVGERKAELDAVVEDKQREIDNYKAVQAQAPALLKIAT